MMCCKQRDNAMLCNHGPDCKADNDQRAELDRALMQECMFYVFNAKPQFGIGDAWSVKIKMRNNWRGGTIYEYGLKPPRYPVPALRT